MALTIPLFVAEKQKILRSRFPSFPEMLINDEKSEGFATEKNRATWGENCWLEYSHYGFQSPAEIKPFFTQLSQEKYAQGTRHFYVEVLADAQAEIQEWFELGFGLQHVSALLQDFKPVDPSANVVIRAPQEKDLSRIAELERELTIHQQAAPVFSLLEPESVEEVMDEWREDLDNHDLIKYVAEINGTVVGLAYGCSTEKSRLHSGLLRPANSATFAFCSVLPEYRGDGIGKALASAVIEDLYRKGFTSIVTDWRATNQLSSNTWPKLGFIPTIYRLHRAI
jgi:ribosomal protein S18 acetylase RimI-like enzyme